MRPKTRSESYEPYLARKCSVDLQPIEHKDFVVGSTLGKGAYAVVKIAEHKETGSSVALKMYDKRKLHKTC